MKNLNLILITINFVLIPNTCHAYIDPASASYIISLIIGGLLSIILQFQRLKYYIINKFSNITSRFIKTDDNNNNDINKLSSDNNEEYDEINKKENER